MGFDIHKKVSMTLTQAEFLKIEDGLSLRITSLEPSIHNSPEQNAEIRFNRMKYQDLLKRVSNRRKRSFK